METFKSAEKTDTYRSWGEKAAVQVPTMHINAGWIWWCACRTGTWEQRQDLASWLGRRAKSSGSGMSKEPWSVKKAGGLQGRHLVLIPGPHWPAPRAQSVADISSDALLKKFVFPTPHSYQLGMASLARAGMLQPLPVLCDDFCLASACAGLAHAVTVL